MTGLCRVGTSGWNYAGWRSRFYAGVKASEWLTHYAHHFCTVEVNGSFYQVPRPETVEHWAHRVPPGFLFALKMWRGVTHYRRLRHCEDLLRIYLPAVEHIPAGMRGPLLIQLPERMAVDQGLLDAFLTSLRTMSDHAGWRVAVEFRHLDWLTPHTRRILDRHQTALCLADMPHALSREPNDVGWVYVRRHGTTGRFAGGYSEAQIARDAADIHRWLDEGRDVFVYYNNDLDGHALDNARTLIRQVWTGGSVRRAPPHPAH